MLPGGACEERELQQSLSAYRSQGEWFRATPEAITQFEEFREIYSNLWAEVIFNSQKVQQVIDDMINLYLSGTIGY